MKISLSVTELKNVFKEIQRQPERIFEMMRTEMTHGIGQPIICRSSKKSL
jgi:hypothetical protein